MGNEASKKIKILVVEDEQNLREILGDFLKRHGYEVIEASHGKDAQELLLSNEVDLIISDIRMPVMDGIELLQLVRQTKNTPFVLMTGFSDTRDMEEAVKLGAKDFVAKPFEPNDILNILEKYK